MLKQVLDYIPPGALIFLGYVVALKALMGGWLMSMIAGG